MVVNAFLRECFLQKDGKVKIMNKKNDYKFEFCITLANMLMNKEPIGSNEKYTCFYFLFANF